MKNKHLRARIQQAYALAQLSSCTRRSVAALIIDPHSMSVIADGYNGPPRKAQGDLCAQDQCSRDQLQIASGDSPSIGCYHAELNAILNAARHGAATLDKIMVCTTAPCTACARAIYHAGLSALYIPQGTYPPDGVQFLRAYGVAVFEFNL